MRTDEIATEDAAEALHELDDDALFAVLSGLIGRRYWLGMEAKCRAIVALQRALMPATSAPASEADQPVDQGPG